MESIKKLREGIISILKVDKAMRKAAMGLTTINPALLKPGASEMFQKISEQKLKEITEKNHGVLQGPLAELIQHNSPEAVKVIQRLFKSNIIPYRLLAIKALSSMSTPEAAKAISKRASFLSGASKEEKDLVKSLLTGAAQVKCACCSKSIRPFPVPPGPWTGTVNELSKLKIESDHGFVCDACNAVVCPVCSGKKASELGVREFVCSQCGAKPLKTIYRTNT